MVMLRNNMAEVNSAVDKKGNEPPEAERMPRPPEPSSANIVEPMKEDMDAKKDESQVRAPPPALSSDKEGAGLPEEPKKAKPPGEEKALTRAGAEKTDGKAPPTQAGQPVSYPYSLKLGAFRTLERANRASGMYSRKDVSPYWVKVDLEEKGIWYRVYTGFFKDPEDARKFKQEHGLDDAKVSRIRYANLIGDYAPDAGYRSRLHELKQLGYSPYIIRDDTGFVRLLVGAFFSRKGAEASHQDLLSKGIDNKIIDR
jgi:cell division septation protein DedD